MKTPLKYNTKRQRSLLTITAMCAFFIIGCSSGNGDDNNAVGDLAPVAPPVVTQPDTPPAVVSTFGEIQDRIFTPTCMECHRAGVASAGLRLDEAGSFAALVEVASTEVPELNRVTSGDPDNSYIVQKIEGTAAVGLRMPLGGPALSDELIQLVRDWISDGALPEAASAALAAQVASTSIAGETSLEALPEELVVVFNEPVDSSTVNASNFSLRGSGGDGKFDDGNEVDVPFTVSISSNGFVATMNTSQSASSDDVYQLSIAGDSDNYVIDSTGDRLDGDSDGVEGGDFVETFTVQK